MASIVTGDLLCLILDLNPTAWAASANPPPASSTAPLSLDSALDQVLVFANAHLALRHENQIAVFAAGLGSARQLYSSHFASTHAASDRPQGPGDDGTEDDESQSDSNMYRQFRVVDDHVKRHVKDLVRDMPRDSDRGVNLVGALSMALCHINRLSHSNSTTITTTTPSTQSSTLISSSSGTGATSASSSNGAGGSGSTLRRLQPRILILSVTQDQSRQYVPIMNCIFTAQKSNIQIDVCKLYGPDAVFLQQACHLTSGAYYKLENRSGLLQYLMVGFLAGPQARRHLNQPRQDQVDLRAACFCHRKIVDVGFVCSVCLSIFCAPLPVCSTCRTKFPMSTLKRLGFGARPPGGASGAGGTNGSGPAAAKRRKVAGANGVKGPSASSGGGGGGGGGGRSGGPAAKTATQSPRPSTTTTATGDS
ncbi:hypothetical protein JCM10212_000593 [Sporobolomyces blumeae]